MDHLGSVGSWWKGLESYFEAAVCLSVGSSVTPMCISVFFSAELGLVGANCEGIKSQIKIQHVLGFQVFIKHHMNYKIQQSIIL